MAHATLLVRYSVPELARRADEVVVARVESLRYARMNGELVTEYALGVESALKGAPQGVVWVTQLGGRERTTVRDVVGTVSWLPGDRVLVFLHRDASGRRFLVGMHQGAFFVVGDALTQRLDASYVDAGGRLVDPPATVVPTLREVRRLLQGGGR